MERKVFEYYEIVNQISEYGRTDSTGEWLTYDEALNDMPNHSDWWSKKGTGRIYHVEIFDRGDGYLFDKRTKVWENRD